MKGEPHTTLAAKSLAHNKRKDLEQFLVKLKALAPDGRTGNATRMHEPVIYVDAVFQGERVRLFYSGESRVEKFSRYEARWLALYREMYQYLARNIAPGTSLAGKAAGAAAPVQ